MDRVDFKLSWWISISWVAWGSTFDDLLQMTKIGFLKIKKGLVILILCAKCTQIWAVVWGKG